MTVPILLLSIKSLLADPNPDDPLNITAADLYCKSLKSYVAKANADTLKYASRNGVNKQSMSEEDPSSHFQMNRAGHVVDEEDAVEIAMAESRRIK